MIKLNISDQVKEAQKQNRPIVAIETTVLTHGLPSPHNIETAHKIFDIISDHSVQPAFIAIADHKIQIGLSKDELSSLARTPNVLKTNRSNLSYCLMSGKTGATTVSTTMQCAALANIKIMTTGGIGGVHRDFANCYDISSDLTTLSDRQVAVICSGTKSILDIPKTLEHLETLGIPIIGYQTNCFPSFYTYDERYPVVQKCQNVDEITKILSLHFSLDKSGLLITNPIPKKFALSTSQIENWLSKAMHDQRANKISGREATPYLLEKMYQYSEGKTLKANQELLYANASLAAQIASAFQKEKTVKMEKN